MARVTTLQSSFNGGVLDPRLQGRVDVEKYYQGVQVGKNVLFLPQGGFTRRPGTAYVDDIGETGRLLSFAFNTEQTYLLVLTDSSVAIYKDGVHQADVATPWSASELAELRYTQSADTMILVHEDHQPRRLVRGASHTSWTLSTVPFSAIPSYNFDDASSPGGSTEVQDVELVSSSAGDRFVLTLEGVNTSEIFINSSSAVTATNMQTALRNLYNTSSTGITVAHVSGSTYRVTFGGGDNYRNWQQMTGTVTDGTGSISVTTVANGSNRSEPVWSSTRGWPRSVTFHEGRLVFGGCRAKPQSIFASVTNDFFNFNTGTGADDDAVFITLDTDQVNAIQDVFPGRHLQIYTSGGEFYEPNSPMTPTNAAPKRQTTFGARSVMPVSVDGATLFCDRARNIREFLYAWSEEAYTAASVSMWAPHLITQPVEMHALAGTENDDANYVYVVNGDGTVAVFNTLRAQQVASWSSWETAGDILSMAVVASEVYFLVQRSIDGATRYFLEQMDRDGYTDCNVRQTLDPASTTVTGLGHLNGEACRVRADGAVMANATPSSGEIELSRDATDVEVGLNYSPLVKPMPLNQNFERGPTLLKRKRIVKVEAHLYKSIGIEIAGVAVAFRQFGEDVLDVPPQEFTGVKTVWPTGGYTDLAEFEIKQDDPAPMTVLGIAVELET